MSILQEVRHIKWLVVWGINVNMPFYEYQAVDKEKGCENCQECLEVYESITSESLTKCPHCGTEIKRKISCPSAFINSNRAMNQYSDVKHAKYWRDQNGIRHKVTPADGSKTSPTVSKQVTASPEQIKARKKADKDKTKKRLQKIRHGFIRKD